MDEKVTANLVCFLLLSPVHTILSPAFIIRFPPVNKLPNKLAPNVPSNILKNPPLCSLISFSVALVTPFNKIPEFYSASIIFIISFKSSCSIINCFCTFSKHFFTCYFSKVFTSTYSII